MSPQINKSVSAREVLLRLKAGERLRTGYTLNNKAWFDNGDLVDSMVLLQLKRNERVLQDMDGFITLNREGT